MFPQFLLYVYDDMAMGQDNVIMFEQCFNINESKGCGKKGHEKWGLWTTRGGRKGGF